MRDARAGEKMYRTFKSAARLRYNGSVEKAVYQLSVQKLAYHYRLEN